jgi:DNA-binding CsgD family transcriptional regulator
VIKPFSVSKNFSAAKPAPKPPSQPLVTYGRYMRSQNYAAISSINTSTQRNALPMDAATLSLALQQHSAAQIAQRLTVSRRTIYRWCKILGIAQRTYRCPNEQLLRSLENAGILQKEIARQFGVSRWTVWR